MSIQNVSKNSLPADVKEIVRQMKDRHSRGIVYPGLHWGVYGNEGGSGSQRLPPARGNQQYYEGRIGETVSGEPGSYRVVLLIDDNTHHVISGYYTRTHYRDFFNFEE